MGDSDSIRFSDGEYIEGSPLYLLKTMTLYQVMLPVVTQYCVDVWLPEGKTKVEVLDFLLNDIPREEVLQKCGIVLDEDGNVKFSAPRDPLSANEVIGNLHEQISRREGKIVDIYVENEDGSVTALS